MYHPKDSLSMEIAGSLTPQLEGAPRSTAHDSRIPLHLPPKNDPKGGEDHS